MATYNPITWKKMLTIPTSTPAPKQDVLWKLKDLWLWQKNETPTDQAYLEGATENIQNVYSGYSWNGAVASPKKMLNIPSADKSVAVMSANKNGTTSSLPQATPANLPWVTKYAGIDKGYWNNQAGIDLVNKQSELDTLSEAEKAQRLAGAYNPTPTVATTQNPVIKKTLDKPQEQTITPAVLQGADMNTLNSTLDELNYKVNVEGKALSKDEYLAYASAKRQLQDMMKPQALTGGLDGLIANKEQDIKQATDESKINNDQELADFTRSQEVYKQAEVDAIEQADEESKKTLWFILWWQGAGQGTFAVEQIGKITQNSLAKKQALNEAVQAKIDLYGSQLRKDSQQTIQAMKDRLDSYYMKAAEFDVDNIKQMNEYNAKEWASKIEQIDKMMALAQSQAMAMQPLTEQEQAQAQAFAGNLYDNEWNFQNNVFEMLYKVNPKLANAAVMQGTAIQKERLSNDLAMRWLDADIKRAQLNKLLNPDVDYKVVANDDWTYTRTWSDWSVAIVDPKSWASTSAVETIKKREGFRDKAYQDSTGTWTIGYWFTNVDWKPVQPWMTMDRWTADSLLWQEISQRQNFMNYITVPLSDSQKAALSSFEFNLWSGRREMDAMPILNKINAGDLQGAGELMKQFNKWKINWVLTPIQWLSNRRNEEARLLLQKDQQTNTEASDKRMSVQGLIQWLWGTEWERATFANNIIKVAERDWITLQEAKKKLGYKSWDDVDFAKSRADQFKTIKKSSDAITKWKQALSLLNSGKATAIKDVASIVWFLKTIDPSSVARESEVESVESARGVLDSLSNTFEKMNTGKKLTDTQRQELKDTIGIIVNEYENNMKDFITSSSQEFDDRWLDMTVYVPKDTINKYKQMQSTQTVTWSLSWWTNRLQK